MAGVYIDFTAIAAIWMGGLLLLVALSGVVLRHAALPFLAALAEYRRIGHRSSQLRPALDRIVQLERRIALLESGSEISSRRVFGAPKGPSSLNSPAGAS